MSKSEATRMKDYATRKHAEHTTPDEWCRKCRREALEEWGRQQGLIK